MLTYIRDKYDLGDFFYIDAWPFSQCFLISGDPSISNQFTVDKSMPKNYLVTDFIKHVGGPHTLVNDEGTMWKTWRRAFNPGFSLHHLMTLVPEIVDSVSIFYRHMDQRAESNDLFRLERVATRLTIDVIGKIVL